MGIEIERKFLLDNQTWRDQVHSVSHIRQGYFVAAQALTQGLAKHRYGFVSRMVRPS